ncbi:MAG: cytochrome P450 [Chloroflexota bacterium]|nr:cytochrome P450 [Chloroflexota bacterium]
MYSDEVLAEPYEHYRRLREAGPAVWLERYDVWVVARYDSVRTVLRNWATFSSASGVAVNDVLNTAMRGNTLNSDPPLHDLLRNVVASRMTSQALRPTKEMIDQRAEALVERLVTQHSFDAIEDLAQALPLSIVPDFIGLPQEGREHLLDWAEATFNAMGPMNERCADAVKKLPELFSYARQLAATGNLQPGSFGAGVLEAQRDGRITEAQCPQLFTAYLVPSVDTTISAVGSAIWLFGRYPDQWNQVRDNPSLIPNAFEEVLRLESPLQSFSRLATSDYDVEGITIPAGSRVVVLFASANRDERKWEQADTFDVTRNTSGHLGFGYGVHLCAGASLARLEGQAILGALARRVERFELVTSTRKLNNVIRSLRTLAVTVHATTKAS